MFPTSVCVLFVIVHSTAVGVVVVDKRTNGNLLISCWIRCETLMIFIYVHSLECFQFYFLLDTENSKAEKSPLFLFDELLK